MSDWLESGINSLRLEEKSLSYLARESARQNNPYADAANAEITRRTAQSQIDAAGYMRWSLIVLGFAAIIGAVFQGLAWMWPNPLHLH
jgi:hypothetical protein